jgi:IS5 family transposase
MSFNQFILREQYQKVRGLGDRLALMKQQIDWEPFRPIIACVYHDNKQVGGRPHTDEVIIARALLLQGWYGLSDEELEFQCNDRLSFRAFLGFPEKVPDFSTIWDARERLKESGKDAFIWVELQRQLDRKGFKISKGVIQDATFIEAERGRARQAREKKAEKCGKEIAYNEKQISHMDKDGTYAVKNGQVHYGYKLHVKSDVKHSLIRDLATTTAKDHDGKTNLVSEGDGKAYRDRGYCFFPLQEGVKDETMRRAARGNPLGKQDKARNKRISKIRSPGERPFAVLKNVFHSGVTYVTTLARVHIKNLFACFAYNAYQLVTLERKRLARAQQ